MHWTECWKRRSIKLNGWSWLIIYAAGWSFFFWLCDWRKAKFLNEVGGIECNFFSPVLSCFCTHPLKPFSLGFIIASYLFSLWFCKPTQSPSLCRSCSVLHGKKGKTLCVCLSSPTALTLQNRTRQSLASKKVTFKKLRAFYSLMRQLNFF